MTFLVDHSRRSWEAPAKTAQRGEVLVVGCSFTQGFGIADEDTFSYLLNQRYRHLCFTTSELGGTELISRYSASSRISLAPIRTKFH